jgi:3-oxoacyl-[acyl-carrier-protein] synthase III
VRRDSISRARAHYPRPGHGGVIGDGAGALACDAVEGSSFDPRSSCGVVDSFLGSDGSGAEVLCMKLTGTARPGFIAREDIEQALCHPFRACVEQHREVREYNRGHSTNCMSDAVEQGRLKEGDLAVTIALRAGFTWGGNLIRW